MCPAGPPLFPIARARQHPPGWPQPARKTPIPAWSTPQVQKRRFMPPMQAMTTNRKTISGECDTLFVADRLVGLSVYARQPPAGQSSAVDFSTSEEEQGS